MDIGERCYFDIGQKRLTCALEPRWASLLVVVFPPPHEAVLRVLVVLRPPSLLGQQLPRKRMWAFGNVMSALLVPGALAAVSGTSAWIIGSGIVDIFLTALVAFVIAWTVGFLIRLSSLPPEYYYRQAERADRLENEQKQAKAKLWELRETGVALRNNVRKLIDETEVAE